MQIDLHTKNNAHIDTLTLPDGGAVPRVGEFIVSAAHAGDAGQLSTFLVVEVSYTLTGARLTPVVRAMAQGDEPGTRLYRLQEQGWLQPTAG